MHCTQNNQMDELDKRLSQPVMIPNISVSELRDQIYNFSLDRESSAENPELLVRENRNKIIFHEIEDNYPQKSSGDTEQLDLVYGNEKSGF